MYEVSLIVECGPKEGRIIGNVVGIVCPQNPQGPACTLGTERGNAIWRVRRNWAARD